MNTRPRTLAAAAAGAVAAFALAGCGASGETVSATTGATTTATATPSPASGPDHAPWPSCSSVWVEGADLPRTYQGCARDGEDVAATVTSCSSGQRVVTFDNRFWAVRGHVISEAPAGFEKSRRFAALMANCRG